MRTITPSSIAACAALVNAVHAQNSSSILRACPTADLCYSLSIPSSTAASGSGSIYFQLQAPTTNAWAALGQGTRMAGANMFVMYQSADGTNVTVSPRKTSGYGMPTYDSSVQVTLLAGSGVSGGVMTANVRCDSCSSWTGGSLDYTSDSSSWIYAADAGTAIKSNDMTATIAKHDNYGNFNFATKQAITSSTTNPFVTSSDSSSTSDTSSSTGSSSDSSTSQSTTSVVTNPYTSSSTYSQASRTTRHRLVLAHAALSTIAFVALFPIGALLMRVGRMGRERLWIHGGVQVLAYLVFVAGAAIGIYIAKGTGQLMEAHPIIGLFLLAFVFLMPFTGYYHHLLFKRSGKRSIIGHVHANAGRVAIILGIINGGLGLQLSGVTGSAAIAYGVLAGLVGVAYLAMIIWWETSNGMKGDRLISEKGSPLRPGSRV